MGKAMMRNPFGHVQGAAVLLLLLVALAGCDANGRLYVPYYSSAATN